ncbi:hypothetical protein IEQ34_012665 [Dendrobium chrysotoxum]|uniref:Uncharacterized protein n=1 Tax=Dendrobium chrysotoxum TaxID=161865 RepID=A0AAV7G639_DENCH|nr:hypothetical protein IEQ34_012665 [Dendrobium chrysotoxum]
MLRCQDVSSMILYYLDDSELCIVSTRTSFKVLFTCIRKNSINTLGSDFSSRDSDTKSISFIVLPYESLWKKLRINFKSLLAMELGFGDGNSSFACAVQTDSKLCFRWGLTMLSCTE